MSTDSAADRYAVVSDEPMGHVTPARTSAETFPIAHQREMSWAYLVAALVGVLPLFASVQFWPVPLVVMVSYLIWGTRKAAENGTIFEFADSFYYLGFTLSVGALLAALEPFHFTGRPDPTTVFHHFGLGMLSTLVGVVGRTVLQTYYRAPQETLEATNQRIQSESDRYLDQLSLLNDHVGEGLTKAGRTYLDKILPSFAKVEEEVRLTGESLQQTNQRLAQASAVVEAVVARLHSATAEYDSLATAFAGSHDRVRQASEGFVHTMSDLSTGVSEAALPAHILALDGAARSSTEALRRLAAEVHLLDLSGPSKETRNALVHLTAQIAGFAASIDTASAQAAKLGDSSIAAAVEGLSASLRTANASMQTDAERTRQIVANTLASAEDLHKAMSEVVDAVKIELAAQLPTETKAIVEGGQLSVAARADLP